MIVELSSKDCSCGKNVSKRTIDIEYFRKDFMVVPEKLTSLWEKKKCWKCKAKTIPGEVWGVSISNTEKNRIFCPKCSEYIQEALDD